MSEFSPLPRLIGVLLLDDKMILFRFSLRYLITWRSDALKYHCFASIVPVDDFIACGTQRMSLAKILDIFIFLVYR